MKNAVDFIKKNIKVIFSAVVIVALVLACLTSVIEDRRKVTKDVGRLLSLNALYDDKEYRPLYARATYDSLNLSTVSASGVTGEIGAYASNKTLTEQQTKDKAALEELLNTSNSSRGTTKGDEARKRNQKYALNKIKAVNKNQSVTITANPGVAGGVYASNSEGKYLGKFVLTGYCPCVICCGKTNGITACGKKATPNHTIAADGRYAFGTQMIINGMVYTVEDRGGAITGNSIDIYFNTHAEALQFGRQQGDVYLYTGSKSSGGSSNSNTSD